MASYGLYTLLTATGTATGTELTTGNNDQRTFQAVCTGSGAVTATVVLEGSLDKSNWVTITTLSLSGTAPQTAAFEHTSAWTYIRARTSGVTGTNATVTVNVALNRKREERISDSNFPILSPEDFGAVGDGVTNDTGALQAWIDAGEAAATGIQKTHITARTGAQYVITSGLTVDCSKVHIDWNYSQVTASAMTSDAAITITGSAGSGYAWFGQNISGMENLFLIGNSETGSVTGIDLTAGAGNAGANHITLRNLFVASFGVGEKVGGNNVYIIKHANCNYYDCGTAVDIPAGTHKGENIRFSGGTFANGGRVLNLAENDCHVTFDGVSMDFNGLTDLGWMSISAGYVFCRDCNIEGMNGTVTPFQVSGGGRLEISGGRFLGTVGSSLPAHFDVAAGSDVVVSGAWLYGLRNTAEVLATGAGRIRVTGTSMNSSSDLPYVVSNEMQNSLVRVGYEGAGSAETALIFVDGAADWTNRQSNPGVLVLSNSATTARTGTRSLAVAKATAAGNAAAFRIYIPILRRDEIFSFSYYHRRPGGPMSGSYALYTNWRSASPNEAGIIGSAFKDTFATVSASLTPADSWTQVAIRPANARAPAWATHIELEFILTSMGIDTFYIDDFVVSAW